MSQYDWILQMSILNVDIDNGVIKLCVIFFQSGANIYFTTNCIPFADNHFIVIIIVIKIFIAMETETIENDARAANNFNFQRILCAVKFVNTYVARNFVCSHKRSISLKSC